MELLVFAHRGEAQEFIKYFSFVPLNGRDDLYQDKAAKRMLLISGEGIYEVFARLGRILGSYNIAKVHNLGIAGSLDQNLQPGDAISVRTVYLHQDAPHFQSFTLDDTNAQVDLITSAQRVLDGNYATELSHFAPAVDRELWAAAKVCKEAAIPLFSTKLVSDMAGDETNCFDLKQRAMEFSTALLEEYLKRADSLPTPKTKQEEPPIPMSFTQKARYHKLMAALKLKEGYSEDMFTRGLEPQLGDNIQGKKQRANLLLEKMENALNPIQLAAQEEFKSLCRPVTEIGAKVLFDKRYEKKKFTLQMEINNQTNIDNLSDSLKLLRFSDFQRIWEGDLDV